LSVTFPDCFVSSVLGAVSVVTFTSYNFSTGGKQHGSLFRFFFERYMKILFSGVFFVFSFQLSDILIECFEIYKLESVRSTVKYFSEFLGSHSRFLSKSLWFHIYLLFLLNYWFQIRSHLSATQHWAVGFPVMWSVFSLQPPSPFNKFSQIRDS